MDDSKVIVTSMVTGQVGINMPDMRVQKNWPKKGSKLPLDKDFLREAIYDPGVEYMFRHGILSFDDMDFKIELGLEEPGTKEPTNIIATDEKYLNRVLKLMGKVEMKKALQQMSLEQKQEFINYASSQKDINLDRIDIINEVCHADILKLVEIKKQMEE